MKETIAVTIDPDDLVYLKSKGISRSKLIQQAVAGIKEGNFNFDFMK